MQRPLDRLKEKVYKGSLWLYILRLLRKERYYVYEIRSEIITEFGFWVGNVTSYKVLYLLEKGGYVKSEKGGREIYYQLTEKGRKELEAGNRFLKTA